MANEKHDWLTALIFILATAGIIGVVLAFNINLARYKLLVGQLSALALFSTYLIGLLYNYNSPVGEGRRPTLYQVNPCDLPLLLFLASGLISYFFVDFQYRDASWTTWFKFFIYGLLYWSLTHALPSIKYTRKLLDVWLSATVIAGIYGLSQYYQVDFFMFMRPETRLLENNSWLTSFSTDLYITFLVLGIGILWGLLLYFYSSERVRDKVFMVLLAWFSYYVMVNHFGPVFPKELADKRIFSTFGNANMYAGYLVLIVFIIFGLLADSIVKRKTLSVWFYLCIGVLTLSNLYLTKTRAGLLAAIITITITIFLIVYSEKEDFPQNTGWRLLFLACILGFAVWYYHNNLIKLIWVFSLFAVLLLFLGNRFRSDKFGKLLFAEGSYLAICLIAVGFIWFFFPEFFNRMLTHVFRQTAREYVWLGALRMFLANPISGTGIGTFAVHYPSFRPTELDIYHPTNVYFVRHAHNEFLEIGAEQGLIGLGMFLLLLYVFYRTTLKQLKWDHPQRFVIIGLLAGISALLLDSLVSVDMRFVSSAYFFWMSLAFTLALTFPPPPLVEVEATASVKNKSSPEAAANPYVGFVKVGCLVLLFLWLGYNTQSLIKPFKANVDLKKQDNFFSSATDKETQMLEQLEAKKQTSKMTDIDFFRMGNIYAKRSDWLKAIKHLEEAVKINPDLFGALNNLGNIAFMHRRIDEAVKYYRLAVLSLAKKPQLTSREQQEINDAYFNLGFAYFKQGELDQALKQFNQVLKNDPDHPKALKMRERLIQ